MCCSSTCASCVNQIQCAKCITGYSLNTTANLCYMSGSCNQMTCNNCSTQSTCNSCIGGYYLNQYTYQCSSCSTACLSCTSSTLCTACSEMYYLNGNICSPCPPNCYQCLS
jgi:hypothetical protein